MFFFICFGRTVGSNPLGANVFEDFVARKSIEAKVW